MGEKLGEILDEISGHFRASLAVQNDPPKFLPKSSQFITPCLATAPVTEISKFHLRELLGLGVPNGNVIGRMVLSISYVVSKEPSRPTRVLQSQPLAAGLKKPESPKSAGESAGKSAREMGIAGGTAGSSAISLLFQRKRPPSTAPSSPLVPALLPTLSPALLGDSGLSQSCIGDRYDWTTGYRTMEMIGGSSASYLACAPCVPSFCTLFIRGGNRRVLDYQGRAGIISIVRWNLRPVIFGVEGSRRPQDGHTRELSFWVRCREREVL